MSTAEYTSAVSYFYSLMTFSFRTELTPKTLPRKVSFGQDIVMAGSCFSTHMAMRLRRAGLRIFELPNGIVYSPMPLANALLRALRDIPYTDADVVRTEEGFKLFTHHGSLWHSHAVQLLQIANDLRLVLAAKLKSCDFLILTVGTSHTWHLLYDGRAVANCHKQPGHFFERKLHDSEHTAQVLGEVLTEILKINPHIQCVLTVSPVRHLRDGLTTNALSKAFLLTALHRLCEKLNRLAYFPASELLLDDLRDYRFYAADMVHPSETAMDYIWQKFADVFLSDTVLKALPKFKKLEKIVLHRPLHNHDRHLLQANTLLANLQAEYPDADFNYFKTLNYQHHAAERTASDEY